MLTVSELASHSGTTVHAVRYYTRMGILKPERHPGNGYRLYKQSEVGRLRFVQQAKHLGYTLKEIGEILHDAEQGNSPCPQVREILSRRIEENREQLDLLMALQARMENALQSWSEMPDGTPNGDSVCHLIESHVNETSD